MIQFKTWKKPVCEGEVIVHGLAIDWEEEKAETFRFIGLMFWAFTDPRLRFYGIIHRITFFICGKRFG